MRVGQVIPESGYRGLFFDTIDGLESVENHRGELHAPAWAPARVVLRPRVREAIPVGDLPFLDPEVLALSPRAVDRLGPVLERWGEILPLTSPDGEFWMFNTPVIRDALDVDASDVERDPEDDWVTSIRRAVFRPEAIGDAPVFKLPDGFVGLMFVTDVFIDLLASSGFSGTSICEVWSDPA